jgi:hypothetical protein
MRMQINRDHPRISKPLLSLLLASCIVGSVADAAENMPERDARVAATPPIALTMSVEDGGAKCDPAEIRLLANSDVELQISNQSKDQITLTAPRIFENKNVLHHDGDLVHVASNDGYLVKANGKGVLKVRTIAEGRYPYGCTSVNKQSKPFQGTLTLAPSNQ